MCSPKWPTEVQLLRPNLSLSKKEEKASLRDLVSRYAFERRVRAEHIGAVKADELYDKLVSGNIFTTFSKEDSFSKEDFRLLNRWIGKGEEREFGGKLKKLRNLAFIRRMRRRQR